MYTCCTPTARTTHNHHHRLHRHHNHHYPDLNNRLLVAAKPNEMRLYWLDDADDYYDEADRTAAVAEIDVVADRLRAIMSANVVIVVVRRDPPFHLPLARGHY